MPKGRTGYSEISEVSGIMNGFGHRESNEEIFRQIFCVLSSCRIYISVTSNANPEAVFSAGMSGII
jgi:hypothetical protein